MTQESEPALTADEESELRRATEDRANDWRYPDGGSWREKARRLLATLDAARAVTPSQPVPSGLDVERLKRAMSDHEDAHVAAFGLPHDCDFGCAADIAEVYAFDRGLARLTAPVADEDNR